MDEVVAARLPSAQGLSPEAAAELFDQHGVMTLGRVVPDAWIASTRATLFASLEGRLAAVARSGAEFGIETDAGFAEIVQRSALRYDILLDPESALSNDPLLRAEAAFLPIVRAILGPRGQVALVGAVVARAGAREQPWHADGAHLFFERTAHLPPHCINVFIPLIDLTMEVGPTEFCPGSHRLTAQLAEPYEPSIHNLAAIGYRGTPAPAVVPAGSAVMFDYRVLHRAMPNPSTHDRPILYVTFALPWFREQNFPDRRLTSRA